MVEVVDPITPEESPASKPGWQTTEFWLTLVAVLVGFLQSQNLFESGSIWSQLLIVAVTVLGALGYQVSRTLIKSQRIAAIRDVKLQHMKMKSND